MLRSLRRSLVKFNHSRVKTVAGNLRISGLGRRNAASVTKDSKTPTEVQAQKADSTRLDNSQLGVRSDAKSKVDSVDAPSLSWHQQLGPVTNFFAWYDRTQTRSPYLTQFFSSLLVYFIGDQLAQGVGGEAYDGKRTLRHILIGAISSVPAYRW